MAKSNQEDSYIAYDENGQASSFVGHDAVEVFRVATIASAIRLLKGGIQPTRGYTMKKALEAAGKVTKKTYTRKDADAAIADLNVWVQTMKAALPDKPPVA